MINHPIFKAIDIAEKMLGLLSRGRRRFGTFGSRSNERISIVGRTPVLSAIAVAIIAMSSTIPDHRCTASAEVSPSVLSADLRCRFSFAGGSLVEFRAGGIQLESEVRWNGHFGFEDSSLELPIH